MEVRAIITLLHRIIRHGKFRHSGADYPERRREMLAGLDPFFPAENIQSVKKGLKNAYLKAWLAQAAFLKNSWKRKGGHLLFPEANIGYIRIPKSASTALSYMMLKASFPDLARKKLNAERINFLADIHLQHRLDTSDPAITFFTVVRNPFRRIVSFYSNYFQQSETPFIYEDYLFGIFRKDMPFKDFIRLVEQIPDAMKDQHLKPQHIFLSYYERKNVAVTILKLEDSETLQRFLSRWSLSPDVLNKSSTSYDYRNYYDRETLDSVYRIYRKDIVEFGYAADYEALRRSLPA